eukprot:15446461-Alexandrium_andersonii.AAC.1
MLGSSLMFCAAAHMMSLISSSLAYALQLGSAESASWTKTTGNASCLAIQLGMGAGPLGGLLLASFARTGT